MEYFAFTKKAVLWDLDNTIYNRTEAGRRMFPGLLTQCLYTNRSEAFIQEAVSFLMAQIKDGSMTGQKAYSALLERYPADKPYDHDQCVDYYYEHIRDFAEPYPEIVGIIQKLKKQGVKMAIVTNIVPELLEHQRKKVETLGIAELFDTIIYSAQLGFHKPDRRIFDHAAATLGVSNEECLFVGDDLKTDIAGAVGAGMEAVWLDHWDAENPYQENPQVHRVKSLTEYFGE